jgi:hypothetical protein
MSKVDGPNVPLSINPCCGYMTDTIENVEDSDDRGFAEHDVLLCLNCGAVLTFIDRTRSHKRYARRIEIEMLPRRIKLKLAKAQRFVRQRGWLPRMAKTRESN